MSLDLPEVCVFVPIQTRRSVSDSTAHDPKSSRPRTAHPSRAFSVPPPCPLRPPFSVLHLLSRAMHHLRYMFVHHCHCSHIFLVSDIRLEPAPATLPSPNAEPSSVPATGPSADGSSNRVAPNHGDVGRPDAGRVSRSGVEEEGERTGTRPAASGNNGEKYPRLSHRIKSNARRCSVCKTMAADVKSYGHPLSDQVSGPGYADTFFSLS